ncbi:unnamed protein product [Rotaria sp. Silwood1]|nr:unnamed protein product [Rotaria sp. Silwood1]CAF1190385.1 unnamed protein product [Rotaria sp. Silwood1]
MASQIEKLKSKANDAFSEENYDEAIDLYTQAIALDGNSHYLYSNRSAAYTKAYKYKEALKDAEQCLKLKSDFVKGYSRKGAALLLLKRYEEAINTYEKGLKIDPNNEVLLSDLETARKAATDVIVVCSSSKFLFEKICKAGGKSVLASYKSQLKKSQNSVISVQADGELASKQIYFLSWKADADASTLRKSIEKFVSDAFEKAVEENHHSMAFPAIGCGQFGCSIDLVAQAMIREVHRKQQEHGISVTFVIQPEKTDIYDAFQNQIQLLEAEISPTDLKTMSATVKKGVIEIEQGNIIKQKVDVIIGTSSSGFLRQAITEAAGNEVQKAYKKELNSHPNSTLIAVPSGALPCKQIFFVKWEPNDDEDILRQSIIDFMSTVVQNMISYKFTSVAFPAVGCGLHGCSTQIVIGTMILEMKKHLLKRDLCWKIKFVVQPDQENIYDEFCKVLITHDDLHESKICQLPPTWEKSTEHKIRFIVPATTDEYQSIVSNFDQTMKGKYTEIIHIERIQNERWYKQYIAHREDFIRRLNENTEKRLYHGCPEQAASLIMEDCFNRSFAGVNGTVYGFGVYFSSNASYSHGYTHANENGKRCMFIARVLVGKTTKGNSSMKTRPLGFDSTTDEKHIFVTYHDAQAYAEYLITYK